MLGIVQVFMSFYSMLPRLSLLRNSLGNGIERMYGTIQGLLEDGVKAGEFPNINPQLLFKAMGGLFMGLVLMGDRKKQVSEKDIEELLNQLIMNPQEQ